MIPDFELDPRLKNDCFELGDLRLSRLLLLNNGLLPWFILVPRVAVEEIFQLEAEEQTLLLQEISEVSKFMHAKFEADKMNVAAIGNIVSQLHVHIVARKKTDCCWPGVVWGTEHRKDYTQSEVAALREEVHSSLKVS